MIGYGLQLAPPDFRWAGERAPGLPVITEPDGKVCEPTLRFFGWSLRYKRVRLSSMRDEGYILRGWFAYLDERRLPWDSVDDQVMIDYRERMREQGEAEDNRINRVLAVIFSFYDHAAEACLLQRDLVGLKGPITTRDGPSLASTFSMRPTKRPKVTAREWACAEPNKRDMTRRPTPDEGAVDAVLTHLRNAAEDTALGDRDWMIARVQSEAGLRAAEVADLTVGALQEALKAERIRVPEPKPESMQDARQAGWNPLLKGLDAVARWEPGRRTVMAGLDRLERAGREHVYVTVVGKGNKKRSAPFPLPLMRDLLTVAIWDVRAEQLRCWQLRTAPVQVFLSAKTRRPLSKNAIGNLVKAAFAAVEVEGSGHRLRARFATCYAERRWAKAFAANLFRWDQTVENQVLIEVAQALGHEEPTTAIRSYVDLGRARYFKIGDTSQLKAIRKVVNALADNQRQITPSFIETLAALIELRAKAGDEGDDLEGVILDIMTLHAETAPTKTTTGDSETPVEIEKKRGGPRLRLVPKP